MADIPMTGVSIQWPIETSVSSDKRVWETDNNEYTYITKNTISKRSESCTLNVKILEREFSTFYSFIKNNFGTVQQFNYAGVQPFITTSTNNDVKIIDYSQPVKIKNRYWEMSFTILRIP